MTNKRVLIVGSARESGGGVSSVIKMMENMLVWDKFHCYWLGTQIQARKVTKLKYALTAYIKAIFIICKYDIIHFHTVPDMSMKVQLPIFLFALLTKRKIIIHLHVCNQLAMDNYVNFQLGHWCMRHADMIVLLADKAKMLLDEYWTDVKTSRCVIYNACNKVESSPYEQHNKTILFCGRFTDNKSADTLIHAFGKIHTKYPDWKLQFLAKGPEEQMCRDLIKKYNMENQVDMPGFVFGKQKDEYFRKAGIFCLCSHYEGFPMVVLEAWAYGVPVITTPVGGLPDVLVDGKNGYSYDIEDDKELSKKLEELINDYELRTKMSEFSKKFVEKFFMPEVINEKFETLYNTL